MPAPARAKTAHWAPASPKTRPFRFGVSDELPDAPLAAGTVIGSRYRIDRMIGEGGMGRVYAAQHCTLGHEVALKLLRADNVHHDRAARLQQEAKAASRIGHRAIVEVLDFDTAEDGLVFLAMEQLVGESYEHWLERPGAMADGIAWLAEVARGLDAAHAAGIVHRDVKPDNVFLHRGPDGAVQPKLLDFGLAKATTANMTQVETQAGTLLGTPYYIAPERALGRPLDPRADLYSLGVMLYETLTGNVPFVDDSFMEILARHIKVQPLDPRQAAPDRGLPDALCLIVMQLLAKDPSARPQSGAAVAGLLTDVLAEHGRTLRAIVTGPRQVSGAGDETTNLDAIADRPTAPPSATGARGPKATAIDGSGARAATTMRPVATAGGGTQWQGASAAVVDAGLAAQPPATRRGSLGWIVAGGGVAAVVVVAAVAMTLGDDPTPSTADRAPEAQVADPAETQAPAPDPQTPPVEPAVDEAPAVAAVPSPPAAQSNPEPPTTAAPRDGDTNAGATTDRKPRKAKKRGSNRRPPTSSSDDPAPPPADLPKFKDVF